MAKLEEMVATMTKVDKMDVTKLDEMSSKMVTKEDLKDELAPIKRSLSTLV
jgi:hypothetical protein